MLIKALFYLTLLTLAYSQTTITTQSKLLFTLPYSTGNTYLIGSKRIEALFYTYDSISTTTTFKLRFFNRSEPSGYNEYTIADQPGEWVYAAGTQETLSCNIFYDSTQQSFAAIQFIAEQGVFKILSTANLNQFPSSIQSTFNSASSISAFFNTNIKIGENCNAGQGFNVLYRYNPSNNSLNVFSFPSSANVQYIPESFQYGIGNNGLYKYNPQTNNYVLLKSLAPKTNYVLKHFQGRILAYGWTTKTININLNSNNIATTASDYQAYIFSDNPNNFTTLDQFSDTALGSGLNFYTSPLMTKLGTGYNQPNNTFFIQARSIDYLRGLSTTLSIQNLEFYSQLCQTISSDELVFSDVYLYIRNASHVAFQPTATPMQFGYQFVADKMIQISQGVIPANETKTWTRSWTDPTNNTNMIVLASFRGTNGYDMYEMYFGNLKSAKDDSQAPSMDSGTYLCDVGCDTCRSTTVCTICKPGFVLNTASSTCTLCPQMCATCGDNGCTQCMDGTYLSNGQCLRCQKPCVTCSSSATACISCPPGLSFFTGKCVKCSKNCITCSSATVCTVCTVGFSLATKEGETICRQCVSKCSSCEANNITKCTGCGNGLQLKDGICVRCPDKCVTCSADQCSACIAGFQPSTSGTSCVPTCQQPCKTCLQTSPTACTACFNGSTLTGTTCTPNVNCNTDASCYVCAPGYILAAGLCLPCNTPDVNCQQCSSDNSELCYACKIGYYLNSNANTCQQCDPSCIICLNQVTCKQCANGYTQIDGTQSACIPCSSPCATCHNTNDTCMSCIDGFSLQGWKCVSNKNVSFSITLNANPTQISTDIDNIINSIIKLLNLTDPNSVTIMEINTGSTILVGSVSSTSPSESAQILSSSVSVGQNLGTYPVLSTAFVANNPDPTPPPPQQTSPPPPTLIIVLAIVIPLSFICIVVITYLIYRNRMNNLINVNPQEPVEQVSISVADKFEIHDQNMHLKELEIVR